VAWRGRPVERAPPALPPHVPGRRRLSGLDPAWLAVGGGVLLALGLLLPGLGASSFDDPGEGQHAEIAREMVTSGDWLSLRLNGVRYFDKPPVMYWLVAASFRFLGPEEWAARLVPLLGAVLAVAATALLGARLLGAAGGLVAGLALLSSVLFVAFAQYLRPETLFMAAIQWGFTGLLLAMGRAAPAGGAAVSPWTFLGLGALGAASLIKDPLGLLGPLAAVACALALGRRARPLTAWLPWKGVGLLLTIGLGWYAVAALRNAGFLWYAAVDNHLLNAIRLRRFPDEDVPLSAFEFLAVSGLGALPWIIPAALTMVSLALRRAWRDPAETPWVALGLWAAGVIVLFAVMPFKLPHYALPAYPAIALLAARAWHDRQARASRLLAVHAVLLAVAAVACVAASVSDGQLFNDLVFSTADVHTRNEAMRGETGPLPPWPELARVMWRGGLVCGVTSAALVVALARRSGRLGIVAVTAGMLALMPLVEVARHLTTSQRTVARMALEIRRLLGPADVLVHEGPIENSGALEFYSGRRPALLDSGRSVLGFGATFPDARAVFWDAERFRREWLGGERRLLLVTSRSFAQSVVASLPPERVRRLLHDNGRWLYASRGPRPAPPPP
jgi:hypothetical protein